MDDRKRSLDRLLTSLHERAKELDCYYQIQSILKDIDASIDETCRRIVSLMPPGWQYPDICRIRITLGNETYCSPDFSETAWSQTADIVVEDKVAGSITVYYTRDMPDEDDGPFLKGETKLLQTICDQLGSRLEHRRTHELLQLWNTARSEVSQRRHGEWQVVVDTLRQSAPQLYHTIAHKMLNHLSWSGIPEAEELVQSLQQEAARQGDDIAGPDHGFPREWKSGGLSSKLSTELFDVAARYLNGDEILDLIQKWLQEDKLRFLMTAVNTNIPSSVVADIIHRYYHITQDPLYKPTSGARGVLISLIRRFLSDQKEYMKIAKEFIDISDFHFLLQKVILGSESRGKLGGKGAGLYLAGQILAAKGREIDILKTIKTAKTWYITSDILLHFIHYNNFDEVIEQKYKPLKQIALEYPYLVQSFKSVPFPPDIITGLSMALDDFGDCPLVVRSSSLLEDSTGAAFPGKYRTVFLANQGSKRKRLEALMNAIAEVYASTFSPDPIEYRADHDLLDFIEEMGILIQEVVGKRFGKYFLPLYAGAAFSCNEFRWSPRIRRENGLIRMVPGLGTRAVERLSNDYPILISPGQPDLRVNATMDEILRYSPQKADAINLETGAVESIDMIDLIRKVAPEMPEFNQIISTCHGDRIIEPSALGVDPETDNPLVTFNGLIARTPFIELMRATLTTLSDALHVPVNIEFASDGTDFFLLQCRTQSEADTCLPSSKPADIPDEDVLFTARRYISNGHLADITHIVYVIPERYSELSQHAELLAVGRAIGKLNRLLPRRKFILMGPGRWGSRGDIRLGVSVDYTDINNTLMLIEIARRKGQYVPELSFGTHFFQDLIESQIRYLPLYPDEENVVFNEEFLLQVENLLNDLLPECAALADTIRVIDIPRATSGKGLAISMNAETEEAVGYFARLSQ